MSISRKIFVHIVLLRTYYHAKIYKIALIFYPAHFPTKVASFCKITKVRACFLDEPFVFPQLQTHKFP